MRFLVLFIILFLCVSDFMSQSSFYKLFSGNGYDIGKGVAEYPDSSFLVTGSTTSWQGSSQVVLLKIDSAGTYEWSNNYGGPETDGANRVLYNDVNGVYAVGYTNSIGEGDYNGLVVHTDALGNEIWQKSFGETNSWEFFNDAVFANDSSILMVGESTGVMTGDQDVYMVRMNADGDTIWTKTILEFGEGTASSIIRVQDSLFIVGGSAYSQDSLIQKGFVMKINMDGDILWQITAGNLSGIYDVEDVSLGANKFYTVGSKELNEDDHDNYMGIFDLDGNTIIEKTEIDVSEIRNHITDEICYLPNLNKVISGQRKINQFTFQDSYDVYFSYYTPNSLLWSNDFRTINNAGIDRVGQLMKTSDGGFIGVGQTTYPLSGGSNIFIFKAGPDGAFPETANYYTIDTLVGLSETQSNHISFSPNPSNGVFQVSLNQFDLVNIEIYNTLGQLVFNKSIVHNGEIDLTEYQNGLYYAKINQQLFKLLKASN